MRLELLYLVECPVDEPKFQFHKGAIRTSRFCSFLLLSTHFNSIKVRLELELLVGRCSTHFVFQFHKGAIRTRCRLAKRSVVNRFQFHKGAIRTHVSLSSSSQSPLFQFHKGAIRTKRWLLMTIIYMYFNSIKVRLEPVEDPCRYRIPIFQFHKGAIRTNKLQDSIFDLSVFQFHKGAIRTVVLSLISIMNMNFNSIKVRLERYLPSRHRIDPQQISIP